MTPLTELSLFSGYGGFSMGLRLAGVPIRTIGYCEIEPYCQEIIKARIRDGQLDDAPIYADIRAFIGEGWAEQYSGLVDIITGGFPCQDISVAGKGLGIDAGERSGLWREMVGAIGVIRPRYALLENVSAILVRGLDRVLGDLAEIGYDAVWTVVSAAHVGAPHIRERFWLLAYARCQPGYVRVNPVDGRNVLLQQGDYGAEEERGQDRFLVALASRLHQREAADWWRTQSRMDRSIDGCPYRVERLKALGNGICPPQAALAIWRLFAALEANP